MNTIECFPALVCAAISGYCMGGGLDLALACHRRIAAPSAIFGHRGAALGLITGWGGTQRLLRLIKSRLSRFVIPGPPSAVRNLLLPHCRFLVATFLGMTKRINLDCDFRRLTFVIPNRLYRLRKKSESRRFAASGAKALAGFARLTRP